MTKDIGEKPPSPEHAGQPATSDNIADLEGVLASFVQTFESSAQRWEQTVYPFITSFEASAKRWERMVYPAIIVFGILGLSGFWLIYSLTADVHELARNVDPKMERNLALMAENISRLTLSVESMTSEVRDMQTHIHSMDTSILTMKDDMGAISTKLDILPPLLHTISEMNQSMKAMTVNTGLMSRDVRGMNENVGRPMSYMNSFAPW
ncbi:MAG: hypothetical protein KZQ91_10555 [Candidatus Thiodiazotropha sp. (ex Lucinoma borealis)]|nr:hypothetical protein [Candidatus Thiodiazotropha sp. (ex Lucinoma borealis)]